MLRSDVSAPESLLWDMMYFIAYVLVSAAGLAMLAAIDWRLAVALLLPLLLSIAVMQLVKRNITRHYERLQQATDTLTGFLGELFRHQETVRLNDAEPAFLRRLQTIAANRAAAGKRSAVLDTALASLYDNIVSVCTALLLLFIAVSMRSGSFSAGSLPFFLIVFGFVSGAIRLFGTVTGDYRKASAALARISGLLGGGAMETLTRRDPLYLQGEPPAPAAPVQAEPLACLELRRIGYTFPGTDAGIRDVSLRLPRGTITVVTGTVGAGKTTLVRTLLGLLPATSGDIVWNGRRIDSPETFLLPPAAAYVPQLAVLFSGTIRGNIGGFGGELDEPTIRAALHAAVLEDDVAQFPDGLETVIGPKGKRLSGGQQQRVAVARMAVCQAQLWVLDDSASGLDAETERLMWQRIDALRRSDAITCIIVSTKPYVLPYADQIVVMRDGCIDTSISRLLA
jgi:ATP-binding cassette subfamily B protein